MRRGLCTLVVLQVLGATWLLTPSEAAVGNVRVTVDRMVFKAGDRITLHLENRSSGPILVPSSADGCSIASIAEAGATSRPAPLCTSRPGRLVVVAPGRTLTAVVAVATDGKVIVGSAAGGRLDADLRSLPVAPVPKAGDLLPPAREVPLGVLPPAADGGAKVGQGTHVLVVRYLVGSARGLFRNVRSSQFRVGT
jgi:hypothetical protein